MTGRVDTLGLNDTLNTKNSVKGENEYIKEIKESSEKISTEDSQKVTQNEEQKEDVLAKVSMETIETTGFDKNNKLKISSLVIDEIDICKNKIELMPSDTLEQKKFNLQPKFNACHSKRTSISSSMPPSDLGDKVVNISAIEIDKNDIEIINSPRKEEDEMFTSRPSNLQRSLVCLVYICFVTLGCIAIYILIEKLSLFSELILYF